MDSQSVRTGKSNAVGLQTSLWSDAVVSPVDAGEEPPPPLAGYMYKKSPGGFRLSQYDWRYFKVERGGIFWWATEDVANEVGIEGCKGSISFIANRCTIEFDPDNDAQFRLEPSNGKWEASGTFSGSEETRTFTFDTTQSSFKQWEWVSSISAHMEYAQGIRDRQEQQAKDQLEEKADDEPDGDNLKSALLAKSCEQCRTVFFNDSLVCSLCGMRRGEGLVMLHIGADNWSRQNEPATASAIRHRSMHRAFNSLQGVRCYSIYPTSMQTEPKRNSTFTIFKHSLLSGRNADFIFPLLSEDEFEAYRSGYEDAVCEYIDKLERRKGRQIDVVVSHDAFVSAMVGSGVVERLKSEGKKLQHFNIIHGEDKGLRQFMQEKAGIYQGRLRCLAKAEECGIYQQQPLRCHGISCLDFEESVSQLRYCFPDYSKDLIAISFNGVDQSVFFPRESDVKTMRRHLLVEDLVRFSDISQVIVFAGQLEEWTRLDVLLHAASLYEGSFPQLATVIVGTGPHEIADQHKFQARSLGLLRVFFVGAKEPEALAEIFSASQLGVFPASNDPVASELLQCMACGTPVIAAKSGRPLKMFAESQKLGPNSTRKYEGFALVDEEIHRVNDDGFMAELGKRFQFMVSTALKADWKNTAMGLACVPTVTERYSTRSQCEALRDEFVSWSKLELERSILEEKSGPLSGVSLSRNDDLSSQTPFQTVASEASGQEGNANDEVDFSSVAKRRKTWVQLSPTEQDEQVAAERRWLESVQHDGRPRSTISPGKPAQADLNKSRPTIGVPSKSAQADDKVQDIPIRQALLPLSAALVSTGTSNKGPLTPIFQARLGKMQGLPSRSKSPQKGARCITTLILPAGAGSRTLYVKSQAGFEVGKHVVIDNGTPCEEVNEIYGLCTLSLRRPLKFDHSIGASIAILKPEEVIQSPQENAAAKSKTSSRAPLGNTLLLSNSSALSENFLNQTADFSYRWTESGCMWNKRENILEQSKPVKGGLLTPEQFQKIHEAKGKLDLALAAAKGHFKKERSLGSSSSRTLKLSRSARNLEPNVPVTIPRNWEWLRKKFTTGRSYKDREARLRLFKEFDINMNGVLGIMEVDCVVGRNVQVPGISDYRPAVVQAFTWSEGAMPLEAEITAECVSIRCFRMFLMFLCRSVELWVHFCAMNTSGTRKVTADEFVAHAPLFEDLDFPLDSDVFINPRRYFFDTINGAPQFMVLFTFSWEQMHLSPLPAELEKAREQRAISVSEWRQRLLFEDSYGDTHVSFSTLTECMFPIKVKLQTDTMRFVDFIRFFSTFGPFRDKWDVTVEPEDLIVAACTASYREGARHRVDHHHYRIDVASFQELRDKFPMARTTEAVAVRARMFQEFDFNKRDGNLGLFECAHCVDTLLSLPGIPTFQPAVRAAFEATGVALDLDYDPMHHGILWEGFYCLLYHIRLNIELWVRFVAYDTSYDDRIEPSEFGAIAWYLAKEEIVHRSVISNAATAFQEMDVDNSGGVRFKEFASFCFKYAANIPDLSGDPMPPEIERYYFAAKRRCALKSTQLDNVTKKSAGKEKRVNKSATPRFPHPTEEELQRKREKAQEKARELALAQGKPDPDEDAASRRKFKSATPRFARPTEEDTERKKLANNANAPASSASPPPARSASPPPWAKNVADAPLPGANTTSDAAVKDDGAQGASSDAQLDIESETEESRREKKERKKERKKEKKETKKLAKQAKKEEALNKSTTDDDAIGGVETQNGTKSENSLEQRLSKRISRIISPEDGGDAAPQASSTDAIGAPPQDDATEDESKKLRVEEQAQVSEPLTELANDSGVLGEAGDAGDTIEEPKATADIEDKAAASALVEKAEEKALISDALESRLNKLGVGAKTAASDDAAEPPAPVAKDPEMAEEQDTQAASAGVEEKPALTVLNPSALSRNPALEARLEKLGIGVKAATAAAALGSSQASGSSTKKGAAALLKSLKTGELSQVVDTMESEEAPPAAEITEVPEKAAVPAAPERTAAQAALEDRLNKLGLAKPKASGEAFTATVAQSKASTPASLDDRMAALGLNKPAAGTPAPP